MATTDPDLLARYDPLVPSERQDPEVVRAFREATRPRRGRPPEYKNPKQFPFRTEAEVVRELDKMAKGAGMTRNALINDIISRYLETAS